MKRLMNKSSRRNMRITVLMGTSTIFHFYGLRVSISTSNIIDPKCEPVTAIKFLFVCSRCFGCTRPHVGHRRDVDRRLYL